MSHQRHVTVLAHYQPAQARIGTSLPADVADLLVQRMVAERITRKVIRMLPPDSVFPVAKFCQETQCYMPEKLPPENIDGTIFQPPQSALTLVSTIPRMRKLRRYREVFGDQQLAVSLLPKDGLCQDALRG